MLPLGSQRVHDKLTPHIKALLLYGHHDTGKKLLAHSVAHSTGALWLLALVYADFAFLASEMPQGAMWVVVFDHANTGVAGTADEQHRHGSGPAS